MERRKKTDLTERETVGVSDRHSRSDYFRHRVLPDRGYRFSDRFCRSWDNFDFKDSKDSKDFLKNPTALMDRHLELFEI